jgi:hypothetical protein
VASSLGRLTGQTFGPTLRTRSEGSMTSWINLASDAWMIISAVCSVLLLVVSGVSVFHKQSDVGSLLLGLLVILFQLWIIATAILIFIKYLPLITR